MAVVTQVSAESVVGGLVKPKRVRKGVLKADNSDNSPKILDKALIIPKTLKTPLNKENSQSNILNIASTIPEKVAIKVKISKQRSKKGENTPIIEQNMPTNPKTDPILVTTAPNNGINEMPFVKNSHADVFVNSIIPNSTLVEQALINVLKKAVGRPRGCLDKVKREAKGDHKLGRPLGSKDRGPRQKGTTPQMS
jgi:hypothetical protein